MNDSKSYGRKVFAAFVVFFLSIIAVNSVFIYVAVKSHTGVVTDNPYEKGLKYNEMINKAKTQPKIIDSFLIKDNTMYWAFIDEVSGEPVLNANVRVHIVRPVQDGFDTNLTLAEAEGGQYFAKLDLPMKGQWLAHLVATWDNETFQTTHTFLID